MTGTSTSTSPQLIQTHTPKCIDIYISNQMFSPNVRRKKIDKQKPQIIFVCIFCLAYFSSSLCVHRICICLCSFSCVMFIIHLSVCLFVCSLVCVSTRCHPYFQILFFIIISLLFSSLCRIDLIRIIGMSVHRN